MNMPRRRCPVCWRLVRTTMNHCIESHWDSLGRNVCPAGGEPYDITIGLGKAVAA